MNLRELLTRKATLTANVQSLRAAYDAGTLTDDQAVEIRQLATDLRDVNAQIAELQGRESDLELLGQAHTESRTPAAGATRASGLIDRTGRELAQGDGQGGSIGQRFVRSDAFRQYRDRVGEGGSSARVDVGSWYHRHAQAADVDPETRALITSGTVGVMIQPQRVPGIFEPDARPLRVRDVMANFQTSSSSIEFVRQASVTNNAAEVTEATSLVTGLKPESGFTLELDTAPVRTIAHLEYATRNALDDAPFLEGLIDTQLRRGLDEREDRQLAIGDGTAPNIRGIYNTPGIQNLNGAYWAANPLPATGAAANKWDRLLRGKTKIRLTGRATASAIFLNPAQIEEFQLHKATNGNYLFAAGGPVGTGLVPTMWGLPVVEVEDMPNDEALIGAFNRYAWVLDRMSTQVYATDSNRDLFERNIITFLAESRVGLAVIRPQAFAKIHLTATS